MNEDNFFNKLKNLIEDYRKPKQDVESGVTVLKDAETGQWLWFGVISNNFLDDDWPTKEIISERAHRNFVAAIDSGVFKEKTGLDKPEHWVFHVPVPIGVADTVAYDERGFLLGAGHGYKGEFYDAVYEGLSKAKDMAMSHTMPGEFLGYNKEQDHIIEEYLSVEFTSLPKWAAANKRTISAHGVSKDESKMPLQIEDPKRDWFIETLGEAVVQGFDDRLSAMADEAGRTGVPSKETSMSEEQGKEQELSDGTPVKEAEVVETDATDEVAEVLADEKAKPKKFPPGDDEEEDEEDEKPEKKGYVTHDELVNQVIPEIVKGVTDAIAGMSAKFDGELASLKDEVSGIKNVSEEQVEETLKQTPFAGISGLFAQSIVGNSKTKVDYNKERDLHQAGPEEVADTERLTGITHIDNAIKEQTGNNRVVSGQIFSRPQQ